MHIYFDSFRSNNPEHGGDLSIIPRIIDSAALGQCPVLLRVVLSAQKIVSRGVSTVVRHGGGRGGRCAADRVYPPAPVGTRETVARVGYRLKSDRRRRNT